MTEFMKNPSQMLFAEDRERDARKDEPNSGDWESQRDATEHPEAYPEENENDNTGGAGSTGSAATNS